MTVVTAIFDVGKTNKKLLLFDAKGIVLEEAQYRFPLISDDDGFPCEDIHAIAAWIKSEWKGLLKSKNYKVVAVNFTSFGATFVHIGKNKKPVAPMYDYMRPMPEAITKKFYADVLKRTKEDSKHFSQTTCSPRLGMLNSGLQLYWLKETKPKLWKRIDCSLHLPQYLSFLISGKKVSDYTSIGCHTALWDFKRFKYSSWITADIAAKLAPITSKNFTIIKKGKTSIKVGYGLHDSSSALIPYLNTSHNSFILISTGTWSIQLNPFNSTPLTAAQLQKDCLCYMRTDGTQVKASRLLLGREHDYQTNRIAAFFKVSDNFNKELKFDEDIFWKMFKDIKHKFYPACMTGTGPFPKASEREWDISVFDNAMEAYHSLLVHLVSMLKVSIQLIDVPRVKTFFVDGGFARNPVFMNVLAYSLYRKKVVASYLPQSTALGAFIHLHDMDGVKSRDFDLHFKVYTAIRMKTYSV
jgi:L-fuculokinase